MKNKDIQKLILYIIASKRRPMTAKEITEELVKHHIKISRPTIARYLRILKDKKEIKEV